MELKEIRDEIRDKMPKNFEGPVDTESKKKLEEIYEDFVWEKGIKQHWENLVEHQNFGNDIYELQEDTIPWYGDLTSWWNEIFPDEIQKESILNYFHKNIKNNIQKVAVETNLLLPQNDDYVKHFFPVLLTAYCEKRNKPENLIEILQRGDRSDSANFEKNKNLFYISPWYKTYSKFTLSRSSEYVKTDDKFIIPTTVYKMYAKILEFFWFLEKFSSICNVTWSFYTFDCMTGYINFLRDNSQVIHILSKLDDIPPEEVLKDDFLKKDILGLVKYFLGSLDDDSRMMRDSTGLFTFWAGIRSTAGIELSNELVAPVLLNYGFSVSTTEWEEAEKEVEERIKELYNSESRDDNESESEFVNKLIKKIMEEIGPE